MELLLTVIILNHNRAKEVLAVYEDLKNQTFQNFNILVLDDNSDSEDFKLLKAITEEKFLLFSYITPYKFGFDLKWNYALKKALLQNPKFIYFIHNDMKINNVDLLEKLVNKINGDDFCGAVGPSIYDVNGVRIWGPGIVKERMGKKYILNETYMVRSKCYTEMGLINEKLIYYGNEYFTFNWLRDNGYTTINLSDVSVTHFGGGVSLAFQNAKDYYRPRTTILIMKLFCRSDSFLRKVRYFYEELSEPRIKMVKYLRSFQFISFFKSLFIVIAGTIAGLIIPIKIYKKKLQFSSSIK